KKFKDLLKELERFEKQNKEQATIVKKLKAISLLEGKIEEVEGAIKELVQNKTEIMIKVHAMTLAWEKEDKDVRKLWQEMNGWVYKGFEETYKSIGIKPEKFYYESDVYNLGKETVEDGLKKGVFFKKDDGSVWIDLKAEGLDDKVVLRSNGTTVYITQDIATANEKERDYKIDKSIYVVGNEQEHHFKVLFIILKKLGRTYADNLFHLSYGMVELPSGKMKSREGTVVDADDLIDEVVTQAEETTKELGKIEGFTDDEAKHLFKTIGLAALKYFILKVDPKKKMLFNPKESLDFHGNTGPFIQASYVRTRAVIRKSGLDETHFGTEDFKTEGLLMNEREKEVVRSLHEFPEVVAEAGTNYSPALIANYIYELAKHYNQFYHEHYILTEPDERIKQFRILLSWKTGLVLKKGMALLGIEVPERM
ncbi:MAG: arginine--tRNA ligase, partial [Bacteroidia bacterium]|nr:arginine--tRNA ligase [Bacteroidia bacterium]